MKKALVTGFTGQDASYLTPHLLRLGYEVHGMVRITATSNLKNIFPYLSDPHVFMHYGDMTDMASIYSLIEKIEPDEIYNLAAQSHVGKSFELPVYTGEVDGLGVTRMLEAIRNIKSDIHFYQASTSELFGDTSIVPQTELTPMIPNSPYAVAKLYAYQMVKTYRKAYALHASNGILFNHESPNRGDDFVTQKIVKHLVKLYKRETTRPLELGNLSARRDWGHAKDYVRAMQLICSASVPGDYVVATGISHTVRDFVNLTASQLGYSIDWVGKEDEEVGYNAKTSEILVRVNPDLYRPADVNFLCGDPSKIMKSLGWKPEYDLSKLVEDMVTAALNNS